MDTFLTNKSRKPTTATTTHHTQPTGPKQNPYSAPKFARADLPADVAAAYDALPETNQHAFRIAYEQLGSSFDYRQCGL